ncbi:MAG: hypothetical protein BWX93_01704 [Bacteroidetes bacterium ADurb.Bin139]|nr:MAG: hypothetical protein BWX93_01704 [Bacteroidetes bacterium ADurb.Bin139]
MYVCLFPGIKEYIPANSAQTPEILVFQVCSIAPAVHFQGNEVISRPEVGGDVKPGFQFAVFRIPRKHSVDPQAQVGSDRSEMNENLPAVPFFRQGKVMAVVSRVVFLQGNQRRSGPVLIKPGVAVVQV